MNAGLEGTWEMIGAEQNGESSSELVALRVELEIATATYVVRFAGEVADRGTYSLADSTLVFTSTEGPNKSRLITCIFQLAGDRLRICYSLDGTPPTAFVAAAGTQRCLATYRRGTTYRR